MLLSLAQILNTQIFKHSFMLPIAIVISKDNFYLSEIPPNY